LGARRCRIPAKTVASWRRNACTRPDPTDADYEKNDDKSKT
jgi:hypothetical protein